jgi:hypothetical protein
MHIENGIILEHAYFLPLEESAVDKSHLGYDTCSILDPVYYWCYCFESYSDYCSFVVDTEPSKVEVPVSKTQVHTIKIVLPVHANHHGTTFGGQVCRKESVENVTEKRN